MSKLDDQIAALRLDVESDTAVESAAVTLIQGIPAMIAQAKADAIAAGATDAQLQSLTDLGNTLTTNATALGAAVAAGTPAPTPTPTA